MEMAMGIAEEQAERTKADNYQKGKKIKGLPSTIRLMLSLEFLQHSAILVIKGVPIKLGLKQSLKKIYRIGQSLMQPGHWDLAIFTQTILIIDPAHWMQIFLMSEESPLQGCLPQQSQAQD